MNPMKTKNYRKEAQINLRYFVDLAVLFLTK